MMVLTVDCIPGRGGPKPTPSPPGRGPKTPAWPGRGNWEGWVRGQGQDNEHSSHSLSITNLHIPFYNLLLFSHLDQAVSLSLPSHPAPNHIYMYTYYLTCIQCLRMIHNYHNFEFSLLIHVPIVPCCFCTSFYLQL